MLTSPLGGEAANGMRSGAKLKEGASGREKRAFEKACVVNPDTGEMVYRSAAVAFLQKQAVDATPGAGRSRYKRGLLQAVVSEDHDGDGYAYGEYYQLHLGADGTPLNSNSGELQLEGALKVGYARVMELRKMNGKQRVLRQSIRRGDASLALAVVQPLVKVGSSWMLDCTKAAPVLVPVLSLGRRVAATAVGGGFSFATAPEVAGGPALRAMTLYENLFSAAKMVAVQKDLVDMSVIELKNELKARNEGLGGNKPCLRRRLHAAIMQDIWAAGEADREEEGLDDR